MSILEFFSPHINGEIYVCGLQLEIPEGSVQATPLKPADVPGSAVLLSRSFAGSPEAMSFNDITCVTS